jgi:integrase
LLRGKGNFSLTADQINLVLDKLQEHPLYEIARGRPRYRHAPWRLLALRLSDVDLDGATVRIERSLEETNVGLRFKAPTTKHGKRTISIPPNAVAVPATTAARCWRRVWL